MCDSIPAGYSCREVGQAELAMLGKLLLLGVEYPAYIFIQSLFGEVGFYRLYRVY